VAEIEGVEGVGGATRALTCARQNCPSPPAITRARLALACTREHYNLVLHANLVLQVRNTGILTAWEGMKFNGSSTFLYMLAEFHLVLHFVLRLRKAPNRRVTEYRATKIHVPL
jgi:hypothetical protein